MPCIANLTTAEFQDRVNRFAERYVYDWNDWLNAESNDRPQQLGIILRKWQACRPNVMRRTEAENQHVPPYLEDLIGESAQYLQVLQGFDLRDAAAFFGENHKAFTALWKIFEQLSYQGKARNGLAGVVGISKSVLLLTDGRVGPAFDSKVRGHLETGNIENPNQWINALRIASEDIRGFEKRNQITIQQATPTRYSSLNIGRIYDMALGPGA